MCVLGVYGAICNKCSQCVEEVDYTLVVALGRQEAHILVQVYYHPILLDERDHSRRLEWIQTHIRQFLGHCLVPQHPPPPTGYLGTELLLKDRNN